MASASLEEISLLSRTDASSARPKVVLPADTCPERQTASVSCLPGKLHDRALGVGDQLVGSVSIRQRVGEVGVR
jgi:hypothetical protein